MKIAIIIVFLTIVLITLISSGLADSKKISHPPIIDASIWTVRESGCQGKYTETWTRRPGTKTFDMSWGGSKDVADQETQKRVCIGAIITPKSFPLAAYTILSVFPSTFDIENPEPDKGTQ